MEKAQYKCNTLLYFIRLARALDIARTIKACGHTMQHIARDESWPLRVMLRKAAT